jgi:hypothetical protein
MVTSDEGIDRGRTVTLAAYITEKDKPWRRKRTPHRNARNSLGGLVRIIPNLLVLCAVFKVPWVISHF